MRSASTQAPRLTPSCSRSPRERVGPTASKRAVFSAAIGNHSITVKSSASHPSCSPNLCCFFFCGHRLCYCSRQLCCCCSQLYCCCWRRFCCCCFYRFFCVYFSSSACGHYVTGKLDTNNSSRSLSNIPSRGGAKKSQTNFFCRLWHLIGKWKQLSRSSYFLLTPHILHACFSSLISVNLYR